MVPFECHHKTLLTLVKCNATLPFKLALLATLAAHNLAALGDATQVHSILFLLPHPRQSRQVQPLCNAKLPFKLASIVTLAVHNLAALGDATQVHSILYLLPRPRHSIQVQPLCNAKLPFKLA